MRFFLSVATLSFAIGGGLVDAATVAGQGYFPDARQPGARIWLENERDYYQRGDRLNVRFAVDEDAYAAVIHIDSDGNLDFLYPVSPWDNEFVRGGQIHSLPARGPASARTVRGRAGIGYLYLVASPTPLDFSFFRGRSGSPWDWGYAGRAVHGDPFLALDQLSRLLVPRALYTRYAQDYYGYYVDGIHSYPAYACTDRAYSSGWGWTPSVSSCGGMDYFLRNDPYYYDTRRYRGDRDRYLRPYRELDPRHGFKEPPDEPAVGTTPGGARPEVRGNTGRATPSTARPSEGVERRDPAPTRGVPQGSVAPQDRPSPERRPQVTPTRAPEGGRPSTGGAAPAGESDQSTTSPGRRPAPG